LNALGTRAGLVKRTGWGALIENHNVTQLEPSVPAMRKAGERGSKHSVGAAITLVGGVRANCIMRRTQTSVRRYSH